jgi:crotonobetainyl-CoA:carnitine CoA-transferase CaiB-like acyl-CoA transferase
VSQLEPATALSGALMLERTVNGRTARRDDFPPGNRRGGAPQGAYRAEGDDRWVVISCSTEDHWTRFVDAIGHPDWADDDRFVTLAGRLANIDELDRRVEAWTSVRDRYDVMHLLQRAGVPAGAVQDAADRVERDEQLAAREHFVPLSNREVGELPLEGVPFRMSATPPHAGGTIRRGPPCLDEDSEAILRDLLGMSAAQIDAVQQSGALR